MKKMLVLFVFIAGYIMPIAAIESMPMPDQKDKFQELDPIISRFRPGGIDHYLIDVESVRATYPELVTSTNIINYTELIPIMISLVQLLLEHDNSNNMSDMQAIPDQKSKFLQLEPIIVKFSPAGTVHYQLDADSVRSVYPELVAPNNSINYTELLVITISLVQQLLNHDTVFLTASIDRLPMPNQRHKFLQLQPVIVKFSPGGSEHYQLDVNSVREEYPELVTAHNIINYTEIQAITISLIQQLLQHGNLP